MKSHATPRSKLSDVGTTIFAVIGQLASEHDALNLAHGSPNFACDPRLVDAAVAAMRAGHNQYAPMTGLPALRAAVAHKFAHLTGTRYDVDDEVTIVASASQGLYAAISGLVHVGDEVIYFEPIATPRSCGCRARLRLRSSFPPSAASGWTGTRWQGVSRRGPA